MHLYNAVQCIGNTLIIISARLISYGHINDMTPATMQNCSAGSVQMSSDPRSSQGLRFLLKIEVTSEISLLTLFYQNQHGKRSDVFSLLMWPASCVHTDVYCNCSHTQKQEVSASQQGKEGTMFNSIPVWPDFKAPGDARSYVSQCLHSIYAQTLIWPFFSIPLRFIQLPFIKTLNFCSLSGNHINKSTVCRRPWFPFHGLHSDSRASSIRKRLKHFLLFFPRCSQHLFSPWWSGSMV